MKHAIRCAILLLASVVTAAAAGSEVADAAMKQNRGAVRLLLQRKADVNAPQVDGTTALHWAAHNNSAELARLLLSAGANANAANRYLSLIHI